MGVIRGLSRAPEERVLGLHYSSSQSGKKWLAIEQADRGGEEEGRANRLGWVKAHVGIRHNGQEMIGQGS